ncbi:hypothetical protein ACA910_012372 [Epithemia clementina (nom. ined.)]
MAYISDKNEGHLHGDRREQTETPPPTPLPSYTTSDGPTANRTSSAAKPTPQPSAKQTFVPSTSTTLAPSQTNAPSSSDIASLLPSQIPSLEPPTSLQPSTRLQPSQNPSMQPFVAQQPSISSQTPSVQPSVAQKPSVLTHTPSVQPSASNQTPSVQPSVSKQTSVSSQNPSVQPSVPSQTQSVQPSVSKQPSVSSQNPSVQPSVPSQTPSVQPSASQQPSVSSQTPSQPPTTSSQTQSQTPSQQPTASSQTPSQQPTESQQPTVSEKPTVSVQPTTSFKPTASLSPTASPIYSGINETVVEIGFLQTCLEQPPTDFRQELYGVVSCSFPLLLEPGVDIDAAVLAAERQMGRVMAATMCGGTTSSLSTNTPITGERRQMHEAENGESRILFFLEKISSLMGDTYVRNGCESNDPSLECHLVEGQFAAAVFIDPTAEPLTTAAMIESTFEQVIEDVMPDVMDNFIVFQGPDVSAAPSQSSQPSNQPSSVPSVQPSQLPTVIPSMVPSDEPSAVPTLQPSATPSSLPSASPSQRPSSIPSSLPSLEPSTLPSVVPTLPDFDESPITIGYLHTCRDVAPAQYVQLLLGNISYVYPMILRNSTDSDAAVLEAERLIGWAVADILCQGSEDQEDEPLFVLHQLNSLLRDYSLENECPVNSTEPNTTVCNLIEGHFVADVFVDPNENMTVTLAQVQARFQEVIGQVMPYVMSDMVEFEAVVTIGPSVSAAPSVSSAPSVSAQPSMVPSLQPSVSSAPSSSSRPTLTPTSSVMPSLRPTTSVRPSVQPTISLFPSATPTQAPSVSARPSAFPSVSPAPTMSSRPTMLFPDFAETQFTVGFVHTCRHNEAPPDYVAQYFGNISYSYEMILRAGTDLKAAIVEGERLLGEAVAAELCGSDDDKEEEEGGGGRRRAQEVDIQLPFLLHQLNSLMGDDYVEYGCPSTIGGTECHVVRGHMSAVVFVDQNMTSAELTAGIQARFQNIIDAALPSIVSNLVVFQSIQGPNDKLGVSDDDGLNFTSALIGGATCLVVLSIAFFGLRRRGGQQNSPGERGNMDNGDDSYDESSTPREAVNKEETRNDTFGSFVNASYDEEMTPIHEEEDGEGADLLLANMKISDIFDEHPSFEDKEDEEDNLAIRRTEDNDHKSNKRYSIFGTTRRTEGIDDSNNKKYSIFGTIRRTEGNDDSNDKKHGIFGTTRRTEGIGDSNNGKHSIVGATRRTEGFEDSNNRKQSIIGATSRTEGDDDSNIIKDSIVGATRRTEGIDDSNSKKHPIASATRRTEGTDDSNDKRHSMVVATRRTEDTDDSNNRQQSTVVATSRVVATRRIGGDSTVVALRRTEGIDDSNNKTQGIVGRAGTPLSPSRRKAKSRTPLSPSRRMLKRPPSTPLAAADSQLESNLSVKTSRDANMEPSSPPADAETKADAISSLQTSKDTAMAWIRNTRWWSG